MKKVFILTITFINIFGLPVDPNGSTIDNVEANKYAPTLQYPGGAINFNITEEELQRDGCQKFNKSALIQW